MNGSKLSALAAAADPAFLSNQTSWRKCEEFDDLTLICGGVKPLYLEVEPARRIVDNVWSVGTDDRAELPVTGEWKRSGEHGALGIPGEAGREGRHIHGTDNSTIVSTRTEEDERVCWAKSMGEPFVSFR